MGRHRVDSYTEAKELSHDQHRVRPHKPGPHIHAGHAQQHGAAGQNMDGIAADMQRLDELRANLDGLIARLQKHREAAVHLTAPLEDGTSPVTGPMRKAFHQRADVDGGVQGALDQYIAELDAVRTAIVNTQHTYEGVESDTVTRFTGMPGLEGTV
jgi:hypothetical protein